LNCEVPARSLDSKLRAQRRGSKGSPPLLVVLSGPSGVGKDAVLARMSELGLPFHYVVTATTRPKRAGEKDGLDYHFLSRQKFQQLLDEDQFLEWAIVYGNYYGVPKHEIASALSKGVDVIVKVDVQGAATIKKILPQAVFIFLIAPSMKELERRLRKRLSESSTDLALRLKKAREETKSLSLFDYAITSRQDKLDDVVFQINAIIVAEKCRVKPRIIEL
jgi:guanylate kinase